MAPKRTMRPTRGVRRSKKPKTSNMKVFCSFSDGRCAFPVQLPHDSTADDLLDKAQEESPDYVSHVAVGLSGKNLRRKDLVEESNEDEPYETIPVPDTEEERRKIFLRKLRSYKDASLRRSLLVYARGHPDVGKVYPFRSFQDIIQALKRVIDGPPKQVLTQYVVENDLKTYLRETLNVCDFSFDKVKAQYKLADSYPLSPEARALGIPQKVHGGGPDLLRFGLESVGGKKIRFGHDEHGTFPWLKMARTVDQMAFIGVAGCGKTRTIYEYLSDHYGVLFIWDKLDNGGAKDVAEFRPYLEEQLKVGNYDKTLVANSSFNLLLLGRLLILDLLLESGKLLKPYDWLLMQLYPEYIFSADQDVFMALFQKLSTTYEGSPDTTGILIDALVKSISSRLNRALSDTFICFHDEAQATTCIFDNDYFQRCHSSLVDTAYELSLLEATKVTSYNTVHQIFSGASWSLRAAETRSEKPKYSTKDFFLVDYRTQDIDSLLRFYDLFWDLSDERNHFRDSVAPWLVGRSRWVASFMAKYMEVGLDSQKALEWLQEEVTRPDPEGLSYSWKMLANSHQERLFPSGNALVRAYLVNDTEAMTRGESKLLENGVANLVWPEFGGSYSTIVEPLAVHAWCNTDYSGTPVEQMMKFPSLNLTNCVLYRLNSPAEVAGNAPRKALAEEVMPDMLMDLLSRENSEGWKSLLLCKSLENGEEWADGPMNIVKPTCPKYPLRMITTCKKTDGLKEWLKRGDGSGRWKTPFCRIRIRNSGRFYDADLYGVVNTQAGPAVLALLLKFTGPVYSDWGRYSSWEWRSKGLTSLDPHSMEIGSIIGEEYGGRYIRMVVSFFAKDYHSKSVDPVPTTETRSCKEASSFFQSPVFFLDRELFLKLKPELSEALEDAKLVEQRHSSEPVCPYSG